MDFQKMITIRDFHDVTPSEQQLFSSQLEEWTRGEHMLPISPDDILKKKMAYVALYRDELIGFIGMMEEIIHHGTPMGEVGSLYVSRDYRQHGVARQLVDKITTAACDQETLAYAFCNQQSLPLFRDRGYVRANSKDVPGEALALCVSECPLYKTHAQALGRLCCDTIMVYVSNGE